MDLPQPMQILIISMKTGLRPIMNPEGATVVISSTGIILIRSPFPMSALFLRHIMSIETMCYCTIGIHEYTQKESR